MFAPDATKVDVEDQLVEMLAEAIYLVARQEVKNKYESIQQPISNQ